MPSCSPTSLRLLSALLLIACLLWGAGCTSPEPEPTAQSSRLAPKTAAEPAEPAPAPEPVQTETPVPTPAVQAAAPPDAESEDSSLDIVFSTGSFVVYPEGTQNGGPSDGGRDRTAEQERKRSMGDLRSSRALRRASPRRVRLPDPTRNEPSPEPEPAALSLAGYDEVWIVARKTREPKTTAVSTRRTGLQARRPDGVELPFPLQETRVVAEIDGRLSSVLVSQRYANPYDETIEAVYVFPLPDDAAVSDFVMTIGERRIRGIVREREEAERVYREARRAGHAASLLTQERPNVFTQRVANIDPGREIEVELRYFNELPRRDGWYELAFPTVVGPRYNPPGSSLGVGAVPRGRPGSSGQATELQYLAPGERTDARFSLSVALDAGVSIEDLESPTHLVDVENLGEGLRTVTMVEREDAANRDFVLRWRVAGEELKAAFLRHEEGGEGWFSLQLEPPADFDDLPRQAMEWVFVLDCSGSMRGEPMAIAKRAAQRVLATLTPRDSFQIIRFSNDSSQLGPVPLAGTRANLKRGTRYLANLRGGGGTQMIEGIKTALDFPHDPERYRMVVFLTDGFIGNEAEILTEVHRRLGDARIFSFAVGSAPNRYLLDRMAGLGRGAVAWVGPNADVSEAEVQSFLDRLSRPALTDIELDFGGAVVADVFPSRIPDVFHGRPVTITGRYRGELPRAVTLRGRSSGLSFERELPIEPDASVNRPALPKVWARAKIRQLARQGLELGDALATKHEILQVALRHGLASDFSAFVAVDALTRTSSPHGTTIFQPVPVPAGVRYDTTVTAGTR